MIRISTLVVTAALLSACSTSGDGGATAAGSTGSTQTSSFVMDVTDIDYGSVTSDRRFSVSYAFPDDRGRFAVKSTDQSGASEPVSDTSEYASVNDDVAASIICKEDGALRKLQSKPTYVVTDRAYQSTYMCSSEG